MPRRSPRRVSRLALLVTLVAVGCGPFGYLRKVARDASKKVKEAEMLEAEKYAPYEYWGAVAYLEQAKVLMAYSEYERSFDYGVRAKQLAEEAIQKVERMESGNMKETMDDEDGASSSGNAGSGGGAQ